MTRIVVVGDLMTDTVARVTLPLAKGSDTPAAVTAAGVSLPFTKGSAARATVSVIRSPTTTMRVMSPPPRSRNRADDAP